MSFLRESAFDRVRRGLTTLRRYKVTSSRRQDVRSILSKPDWVPTGRPPAVAVELSSPGVLAASSPGSPRRALVRGVVRRSQVIRPSTHLKPLPEGALVGGIGEPNLRAPEVGDQRDSHRPRPGCAAHPFCHASRARHGGPLFVLDFDSLPGRAAEAIPILRFRLRKTVPSTWSTPE